MIACASGCTLRDRHKVEHPEGEHCAGCLPYPALDGLRVCGRCCDRATDALRALPDLWADVQDAGVLKARSAGSRGAGTPLPVDPDAVDWRQRVRACLVGWCLVLEEDFGMTISDAQDSVQWMASRVRTQAQRILAHPEHADQLVADLCGWDEDGRRHEGLIAEGRRLMGRGGAKPLTIQCQCGQRVRVDADNLMECRNCGEWGDVNHWMRFAPEIPGPRTAQDTINWLLVKHGEQVQYATLRQWRVRHEGVSAGRDDNGRALYDGDAVLVLAQRVKGRTA